MQIWFKGDKPTSFLSFHTTVHRVARPPNSLFSLTYPCTNQRHPRRHLATLVLTTIQTSRRQLSIIQTSTKKAAARRDRMNELWSKVKSFVIISALQEITSKIVNTFLYPSSLSRIAEICSRKHGLNRCFVSCSVAYFDALLLEKQSLETIQPL
jgi:hypothetical protein